MTENSEVYKDAPPNQQQPGGSRLDMLAPIQDVTSQSPSVSLMNKRALDVNVQGSPRAAPADEHHFRNHHVNYSFGQ